MARSGGAPRRHAGPPPSRPERDPLPPPGGPFTSFTEGLVGFCVALGQACALDDLAPHQRLLFDELQNGPVEQAVADLYDWSRYDLEALRERGGEQGPARPRVALTVERTNAGT